MVATIASTRSRSVGLMIASEPVWWFGLGEMAGGLTGLKYGLGRVVVSRSKPAGTSASNSSSIAGAEIIEQQPPAWRLS